MFYCTPSPVPSWPTCEPNFFTCLESHPLRHIQCHSVRVLAARPLRVRENWSSELFGDYTPETMLIRVWMRTAVRKEVTSFGTFLSTLCHEFCHHLDFQRFGFADSWHTRGFYERTAALYPNLGGAVRFVRGQSIRHRSPGTATFQSTDMPLWPRPI